MTSYSFLSFFRADENECEAGVSQCDENADCTNTEGSFTCGCQVGYTGDGFTCDCKIIAPIPDSLIPPMILYT